MGSPDGIGFRPTNPILYPPVAGRLPDVLSGAAGGGILAELFFAEAMRSPSLADMIPHRQRRDGNADHKRDPRSRPNRQVSGGTKQGIA